MKAHIGQSRPGVCHWIISLCWSHTSSIPSCTCINIISQGDWKICHVQLKSHWYINARLWLGQIPVMPTPTLNEFWETQFSPAQMKITESIVWHRHTSNHSASICYSMPCQWHALSLKEDGLCWNVWIGLLVCRLLSNDYTSSYCDLLQSVKLCSIQDICVKRQLHVLDS